MKRLPAYALALSLSVFLNLLFLGLVAALLANGGHAPRLRPRSAGEKPALRLVIAPPKVAASSSAASQPFVGLSKALSAASTPAVPQQPATTAAAERQPTPAVPAAPHVAPTKAKTAAGRQPAAAAPEAGHAATTKASTAAPSTPSPTGRFRGGTQARAAPRSGADAQRSAATKPVMGPASRSSLSAPSSAATKRPTRSDAPTVADHRAGKKAGKPAAIPAPPPRESAPTQGARLASQLHARYPLRARRNGWQGLVTIKAEIGRDGGVIHASVVRSSGHRSLDRAALAAVRTASFRPAEIAGRAVASVVILPVRFRLSPPS